MKRRAFVLNGICTSLLSAAGWRLPQARALSAGAPLSDAVVMALRRNFHGAIYRDGDARYEVLREVWSAKVDQHPALILHPIDVDDVSAGVRFANANGLTCAIRCGGHSYAGYGTCEGGVLFDMSGFREVTIRHTNASVRLGGGVLCGAVEIETAKVDQAAVLGQCPSVGVGGFLLGGGVGPLMSKYGLGCDSVLAADMVLADGRQITVSDREHPDLYWALRGGGGNFGVVTAFEVALHPVEQVFAGMLVLGGPDTAAILKLFWDFQQSIPDELTLIAVLRPNKSGQLNFLIQCCYLGSAEEGAKVLAPLRNSKMVVHDHLKALPYLELEQQTPSVMPRAYNENRGGFLADLDERTIGILLDAAQSAPGSFEYWFIHLHGAPTRVPLHATAFSLRSPGCALGITADWQPPTGGQKSAEWVSMVAKQLTLDANGNYVNQMDREEQSAVQRAYGANYARLRELKSRYDPGNMFRYNQNVLPSK